MKQYASTSTQENVATRQSRSTKRVFSSSFRKNARLAMRLIRWQHWLVLKLRNGLMAYIVP